MNAHRFNFFKTPCLALFLLSALQISSIKAQTIVLQEEVVQPHIYGVNQSRFLHFYFGYGCVAGKNEPGSEINFGKSGGFRYGLRYKQKITNWLALGLDLGYHGTNFALKQTIAKNFPDGLIHKSQQLAVPAFETGLFARFNFDPGRGNYMGNFLDVGIAYNRNIAVTQSTKDVLLNGTEVEVNISNMNYINYDNWLLMSRVGKNKLMLTASYRLNEVFISDKYNDFPRFILGLEIGFY